MFEGEDSDSSNDGSPSGHQPYGGHFMRMLRRLESERLHRLESERRDVQNRDYEQDLLQILQLSRQEHDEQAQLEAGETTLSVHIKPIRNPY